MPVTPNYYTHTPYPYQVLDISGNEFSQEQFDLMRLSMTHNRTLISLDMRRNPGYVEGKGARGVSLMNGVRCMVYSVWFCVDVFML
ncbi:hypothetical protein EON63_16260 [archaeon]|nr:MAG: hypothetical protein EON63_16260 [archaeon]